MEKEILELLIHADQLERDGDGESSLRSQFLYGKAQAIRETLAKLGVAKRIDEDCRDVTDLPGLWDEGDEYTIERDGLPKEWRSDYPRLNPEIPPEVYTPQCEPPLQSEAEKADELIHHFFNNQFTEEQQMNISRKLGSSSNRTLTLALRALAKDVQCDDGLANECLLEAAERMEKLSDAVRWLHSALHQTSASFVPSTDSACKSNAIALRATEWLVEESRLTDQ